MTILVMKWKGKPREGEEYEKDKVLYKRYEQMLKDDPVKQFERDLGI
jgi:steroid 5-alpha reductase family enzyme